MAFDPYWDNVVLNMRMEGANNSTTFIDDKGHTVTAFGNAKLSTTAPLSGVSSGLFDGTVNTSNVIAASSDWVFSTGDFTVEFLFSYSALSAFFSRLVQMSNGDIFSPFSFSITSGGSLSLYMSSTGSTWGVAAYAEIMALSFNTQYHVELDRSGNNFYLFVDGVLKQSFTSALPLYYNAAHTPIIGGQTVDGNRNLTGKIDNVRITKGIARHTTTFTPPTELWAGVYTGTMSAVESGIDTFTDSALVVVIGTMSVVEGGSSTSNLLLLRDTLSNVYRIGTTATSTEDIMSRI
jgi:hypothetical protein